MKVILTVFCLLFTASSVLAKALPKYDLVILDWGRARAISDNGNWVVTESGHDSKIWHKQKLVAFLSHSTIFNINDFGTITGIDNVYWGDYPNFFGSASYNHYRNNQFYWNLIFPPSIYISSLNNKNMMVGGIKDQRNQVILQPNEKPVVFKSDSHTYLYSINDLGNQLWVYSADGEQYTLTFLIDKQGKRTSLGSDFYPVDMTNTSNYVIGANIKGGYYTRWDPKNGFIKLETPPYYSYLNKVNKQGSIVANGGLLWLDPKKDPSYINLNQLMSDSNRYKIIDAVSISDDGKILVTVYVKIDDPRKPYWRAASALLIPKGFINR